MKVLVTYYSETGNTEKIARAIYDGIHKGEKQILPIQEAGEIEDYDLIFCGFPVQASSVPLKIEPFLKAVPKEPKVAFFATHGSLRGGQLAATAFDYATSLAPAQVIGTFGCRGKVKQGLLDQLMKKPEHKAWAEEAQGAAEHPDEADCEDSKDFAKRMVSKVLSM
jgi:flavodoxin